MEAPSHPESMAGGPASADPFRPHSPAIAPHLQALEHLGAEITELGAT